MRALFVLALCAATLGGLAALSPVEARPTCSPVYALEHGGPEEAVACIQRNMNPCHYAYPHPCA